MTQKQKCIEHCKNYLSQRNLSEYFDSKEFDRIYKSGGSNANAFCFGMRAGDIIIRTAKPQQHDTGNAN